MLPTPGDSHEIVDLAQAGPLDFDFSEAAQAALETINRRVAMTSNLEQVMNFLYDTEREIIPCDRMSLAMLDEEGNLAVLHWIKAEYEPLLMGTGFTQDVRKSSIHVLLASGNPRIIGDLRVYSKYHPESSSTPLLVQEGIRSSLACVLSVEGHPLGVLFRCSKQPNAYTKQHVMMHMAISEQVSQAIEKAYRIEQLTAANHAYLETLGFVSHELKNPVASLVMDAKVLLGGYLGHLETPQRDKLERMVIKGEYLLGLVREYLDLARIEGTGLDIKARVVADFFDEVIEPAVDLVRIQMEEKRMQIFWSGFPVARGPLPNWAREHEDEAHRFWTMPDPLVRVECDPALFRIVITNLLGNAVKYGFDSGEIRIRAQLTQLGFRLTVWNTGPGFPESEKTKLFRKFSRLQTPELMKHKGIGIGLYTVWRIVQLHHGTIQASSEPGHWAEFTIEIPQPLVTPNTE